jgi:hypothetical protein
MCEIRSSFENCVARAAIAFVAKRPPAFPFLPEFPELEGHNDGVALCSARSDAHRRVVALVDLSVASDFEHRMQQAYHLRHLRLIRSHANWYSSRPYFSGRTLDLQTEFLITISPRTNFAEYLFASESRFLALIELNGNHQLPLHVTTHAVTLRFPLNNSAKAR